MLHFRLSTRHNVHYGQVCGHPDHKTSLDQRKTDLHNHLPTPQAHTSNGGREVSATVLARLTLVRGWEGCMVFALAGVKDLRDPRDVDLMV